MTDAAPASEPLRIKSLDVMRGFAVLGILAVNAAFFAAPWQASVNPTLPPLAVTDQTSWSWSVMHVFFEFKCITLFSLLFGASLYMVGGERDDRVRGGVLRRRLFWLLIFGLLHALLIWYGDILVVYALTGFVVLFARSWPASMLISVGAGVLTFSVAAHGALGLAFGAAADRVMDLAPRIWAPPAAEIDRMRTAYQAGLASALAENFAAWRKFMESSLAFTMVRTAGVMLIGMGLFKSGFLRGNAPNWLYGVAIAGGVASLGFIAWQAQINAATGFDYIHMYARGMFANTALSIFVSTGYASLFVLLVKAGVRVLTEPLAAVGRMAFTNYLTQSLIMTTIFWGGPGAGLWGEVDRVTLWGIVLGVWALQLVWSPLWLSRFRMGPFEWIWRRLSYARPLAITKQGGGNE